MTRLHSMALVLGILSMPVVAQESDGPPIAILSPDAGITFAYGTVQSRALVWSKKDKMLYAEVTFTDSRQSEGGSSEDTHSFRFPGVTFDMDKKIFFATTEKGEKIPVAQLKKQLFLTTIVVTPNAHVRISHPRGMLSVSLEAIRPDDPAIKSPTTTDPDATHNVDIKQAMQ